MNARVGIAVFARTISAGSMPSGGQIRAVGEIGAMAIGNGRVAGTITGHGAGSRREPGPCPVIARESVGCVPRSRGAFRFRTVAVYPDRRRVYALHVV